VPADLPNFLAETSNQPDWLSKGCKMRKTLAVVVVLSLIFVAAAVWPFTALYDIATKAEAADSVALNERLDLPALRRSLTNQLIRTYIRISGIRVNPGGIIAGVAGSIVDPIVEKLMTPEVLTAMLRTGWPGTVLAERPAGLRGLASVRSDSLWALFLSSNYGLSGVSVSVPPNMPAAQQYRVTLSLSKQGWRLSALDMPEQIQVKLVEQLLAQRVPSAAQ
jgi:Protein of unknown function (DUF2939)